MNLFLRLRSVLAALSGDLATELDTLLKRLNTWGEREHHTDGTHGAVSVTGLTFNGTTQTTVGAAGGASALPATPTGYLVITVAGTDVVVPYYTQS